MHMYWTECQNSTAMSCGRNPETVQEVEGQDLYALLTDGSRLAARQSFGDRREAYGFVIPESVSGIDPDRYIVSHYPHAWKPYVLDDIDFLSSIRSGRWKLVYRMRTRDLELYDLSEDIGEERDVAGDHPEIVSRLAGALSDRLRRFEAPMPTVRGTGETVPMPDEVLNGTK